MGRVVCVRGAGAVRVAGDELLALLAFVVHRVAQHARKRREEEHETTAKDKDAAGKIEPFAARDLWEESISLGTVVCLGPASADDGSGITDDVGGQYRMQFNFQALHCRAHHGRHQSKRLR